MSDNTKLTFTPVIGIEIHIQLKTKSKVFCSCSADYTNDEPNSHICPVCMGLPGSMPVLNKSVIQQGMLAGMALNCTVQPTTYFFRKSYYYPDLPKNYQITQSDLPIAANGWLEIKDDAGNPKTIRINRLHLEEDVGKLHHSAADGRLEGAETSWVDYNRSGLPLAEIVSEPDVSSAREAVEYVTALRRRVRYAGASDVDLEKGMMRFDANVSVKCSDGRWGRRVEVKNMNSFRALERAIEYEIKRQSKILAEGGEVLQETRHWNDAKETTTASRVKEFYRKFIVEPDLPPLVVSPQWVEEVRGMLPEMPNEKAARYKEMGLSEIDAGVLTDSIDVAQYFEACVAAGANPLRAGNWVRTEVLRAVNDRQAGDRQVGEKQAGDRQFGVKDLPVKPDVLAELIRRIDDGKLSTTLAKNVFEGLLEGLSLDEAVKNSGAAEGGVNAGALEDLVSATLAANADVVGDIRSGKDTKGKKVKFLQGLIMRETKGQARPEEVAAAIESALANPENLK
ncbi:MAG: Asp-tRNA(Asn)/Glu-tRNA(Gln) amidotransferase subunit GatB [Synergistaceae bacterium]|jgi:aspartyl-tRNA(Asn)/glutamyl-tRNA(Gln) amidotransferase subunit B|nr:Asp-tRNA(Asn)/Glu-tRNA(Gln) amidotransferase subunit GatB [Synergistaceae bacterium]